jgi:hypothetical protein
MRGPAPTNAATPVPTPFAVGDYSITAGLNGVNSGVVAGKALDSNINASTLSTTNFHMSVVTTTAPDSSGAEIGIAGGGGTGRAEIGRWNGGAVNEFGTGTTGVFTIGGGTITGFKAVNRAASGTATVRAGGATSTHTATAAGSFQTGDIWVFARNPLGGGFESAGPRIAWYSIGTALADVVALETRVNAFRTAIAGVAY